MNHDDGLFCAVIVVFQIGYGLAVPIKGFLLKACFPVLVAERHLIKAVLDGCASGQQN